MKKILLLLTITLLPITISFSMEEKELERVKLQQELFDAVKSGDIAKVKHLHVIKGARLMYLQGGYTPLTLALVRNDLAMVKALLHMNPSLIDLPLPNKQTVLEYAVLSENLNLLQTILDNILKINIDNQNTSGDTPLIIAIKTGNINIIKTILAEVPDPSIQNRERKTAKDYAIALENNQKEVLGLLETAQKQFNLYKAIEENKETEEIKNLITPDISLNLQSSERSPLGAAIISKNLDLITFLVKHGANVNQQFELGFTPLFVAVMTNSPEIITFLLGKKADPNAPSRLPLRGATPLFFATSNSHLIEPLVKAGAEIDTKISPEAPGLPNNITPLMVAAQAGEVDAIRKLLRLGANPSLKNSEGETALDIAKEMAKEMAEIGNPKSDRYKKIVKLLEKAMQTSRPLLSRLQNLTQKLKTLEQRLLQ